MPLDVAVVSPEREIWSGEAKFLLARSEGGEIGIMPGHAPFLGVLKHARLKVESEDGDITYLAVHGGFIEVKEDRVSVLARSAEPAEEIDVASVRAQLEEAQRALEAEETDETREAVLRAEARLATAAEAGLVAAE